MQTQPTKSQNDETPGTVSAPTLQPWVKPTFQQVPLADALAGPGGAFDGATYS